MTVLNRNYKTRRLKLRRIDVLDILLLIACHYDEGEKWKQLHDEIRRQLDEQEAAEHEAIPYHRANGICRYCKRRICGRFKRWWHRWFVCEDWTWTRTEETRCKF